jgi:O-antigen/teichoic acid export membrane protein
MSSIIRRVLPVAINTDGPLRPTILGAGFLSVLAAALGQVLMFASAVVIARYHPELSVAVFGIFFSLFNLSLVFSSLRLDQAILYGRSALDVIECGRAAVIASAATSLAIFFASLTYFMFAPDTRELAFWLAALLSLAVTLSSISRTLVNVLIRLNRYFASSIYSIMRPSYLSLAQMATAISPTLTIGLPASLLASQVAIFTTVLLLLNKKLRSLIFRAPRRKSWQRVMEYKQFSIYGLPQNVVFVASESVVPLSFAIMFPGSVDIAMYWLASRVVFAPATVFAESLRSLVYRDVARAARGRVIVVARYSALLLILVGGPVIFLSVFGGDVFGFVFGSNWVLAASYAVPLGAIAALNAASLPLVGAVPIIGMQRSYLIFEIFAFAVRLLVIFIPDWSSPLETVVWTSVSYAVLQVGFFSVVLWRLNVMDRLAEPEPCV